MKRLAALCLTAVLPLPAMAQDAGWNFDASIYAWVPGLSTTVDTRFGDFTSESSGGDVLDNLDMAVMGTLQAQKDKWSLALDMLYVDLSASNDSPAGLAYSSIDTALSATAISGYGFYAVSETPQARIDLGGGFRYMNVDLNIDLNSAGTASSRSLNPGESWTVPIIAGRIEMPINDQWFVTGFADYGGTGSDDETWQVLATVGYRFNDQWSIRGGYRYFVANQDIDNIPTEMTLSGPIIGVTAKF